MLERRAAKLFEHLRDALGQGLLAGPLGPDYTSVLRTSLLPVPAYCARSSAAVFLGERLALLALRAPVAGVVDHQPAGLV